jgi:DNA-binding response OmpR family regulator
VNAQKQMARPHLSGRLLLIVATSRDAERFAHALAQYGQYAFIFAYDVATALNLARTAEPDLTIIALSSEEGIAMCQALRNGPGGQDMRLLLVLDRRCLRDGRAIGANGYVLHPASAFLVAAEAHATLSRPERRQLLMMDRRMMARGGRRVTDIGTD